MNKAEHVAMHELGIKHHHHLNKKEVTDFFNKCAPGWDAGMIRHEHAIGEILKVSGIGPGKSVLDVACGTGVLIQDYMMLGASSITGVDISIEMLKIAKSKFPVIDFVCADAAEYDFRGRYDCVMVFNAFPHFDDPDGLIANLAGHMNRGGRLTIAHDMSRSDLDRHHSGGALKVSVGLMSEDSLAEIMGKYLTVDTKISDDEKFIVSGVKND